MAGKTKKEPLPNFDEWQMCLRCQKQPAESNGLCRLCRVEKDAEKNAEADAQEDPSLTQNEIDSIVAAAAVDPTASVTDLVDAPPEEHEGARRVRLWLLHQSYEFRRDIIRSFMQAGLSKRQIFAQFYRTPELKKRWLNTNNALDMLNRDIDALKQEKTQRAAVSTKDRQQLYLQRLEMYLRIVNARMASPQTAGTVTKDMLALGIKLSRDIAVLEHAIRPVPGQGDMPTGGAPSNPDEDPESEDVPYGNGSEFDLPNVEED